MGVDLGSFPDISACYRDEQTQAIFRDRGAFGPAFSYCSCSGPSQNCEFLCRIGHSCVLKGYSHPPFGIRGLFFPHSSRVGIVALVSDDPAGGHAFQQRWRARDFSRLPGSEDHRRGPVLPESLPRPLSSESQGGAGSCFPGVLYAISQTISSGECSGVMR